MANKKIKRRSISLVIRETQIKTTMRKLIRMAKKLNRLTMLVFGGVEELELCWW